MAVCNYAQPVGSRGTRLACRQGHICRGGDIEANRSLFDLSFVHSRWTALSQVSRGLSRISAGPSTGVSTGCAQTCRAIPHVARAYPQGPVDNGLPLLTHMPVTSPVCLLYTSPSP